MTCTPAAGGCWRRYRAGSSSCESASRRRYDGPASLLCQEKPRLLSKKLDREDQLRPGAPRSGLPGSKNRLPLLSRCRPSVTSKQKTAGCPKYKSSTVFHVPRFWPRCAQKADAFSLYASFACPSAAWDMSLPTKIGGFVADLPGVYDRASGEVASIAPPRATCLAFPQVAMRVDSRCLQPIPVWSKPASRWSRIPAESATRGPFSVGKGTAAFEVHSAAQTTTHQAVRPTTRSRSIRSGYPSRIARARAYFSRLRASCSSGTSGQPA